MREASHSNLSHPEIPHSETPTATDWEELSARTRNNIEASRAVLKDAANVIAWSRVLAAKTQSLVAQSRQKASERAAAKEAGNAVGRDAAETKISVVPLFSENYVLVIRVDGDLDLFTSPHLLSLLLGLAAASEETEQSQKSELKHTGLQERGLPVVLDFHPVGFMDGSGVSALIQGRKALVQSRRRLLILLQPGSQPERVFQATGLAKIIARLQHLDEL